MSPTPTRLPIHRIRRARLPGPRSSRGTNRSSKEKTSPWDLEQEPASSPAPPRPSTAASAPPARPGGRRYHATAAARRRADTVHATRGRRPGEPGPNQGSHSQRPTASHHHPTPARPSWKGGTAGGEPPDSTREDQPPRGRLPQYDHGEVPRADPRRPHPRRCWSSPAAASGDGEGGGSKTGRRRRRGVRVSPLPSP
jgi:hypothetical protein